SGFSRSTSGSFRAGTPWSEHPPRNGSGMMPHMQISMSVNGGAQAHDVEPRTLLVHFIRESCGLTGTKVGCDTSSCGACTVLLDGEWVESGTLFAAPGRGSAGATVDGVA